LDDAFLDALQAIPSNPAVDGKKDQAMQEFDAYERIVELYLLHILPPLEEWETARAFLQFNTIVSERSKQVPPMELSSDVRRHLKSTWCG
jgi:hypothetical protein